MVTRKQRRLVEAIAEGCTIEEAAQLAQYNTAYAMKLMAEPAISEAVDALIRRNAERAQMPEREKRKVDPKDVLQSIIENPMAEDALKINAIKALAMLQRQEVPPMPEPPVIVDDISVLVEEGGE